MKRALLFVALSLSAATVSAQVAQPQAVEQALVVSDIRVEGLQRISPDTVFSALPIGIGDPLTPDRVANAARALFRTGNFDDIQFAMDGNVLVVIVAERPSISEITIDGNKALKTEALMEGLERAGLAEGQVFKRSTLDGMRMELTRQYVSQGRYDASIDTDVIAQPRNRVSVSINIDEGNTASIKHINIVGNELYSDEELLDMFELRSTGWLSWITSNDKYAREKLKGDLETLESFYMDRGYVRFNIDSSQVSISPNRKSVYITINIDEGKKYDIENVELSGDIVLPESDLERFLLVQEGQTFSQSLVTRTEELLTQRLGNEGYNFAKVSGIPEVSDDANTVDVQFFIDPGKRTYVRRINFSGNTRTADEVLRREMRQMEAAPASAAKIEQSRVRLERLGFFKEAKVETREVPGTDDLIDLEYSVEEQSSGSLGASIGFSQDSGLLLGANIQQNNFLGTGKQVGIGISRSDFLTNVSFNYLEPYYTEDGVARGFSVFYRKTDLEEVNIASYTTDTYGATLNFSYPISEIERLGFSFGYANTEIEAGIGAVQEITASPRLLDRVDTFFVSTLDPNTGLYGGPETLQPLSQLPNSSQAQRGEPGFLDIYGSTFDNLTVTASWRQSTLNRGLLATRGASQSVAFEVAIPGSDLEFYKLSYNGQLYIPINRTFTMRLRTELGYGDGYGDVEELPFFENFYAGGFGSVRGYKSNTLGPRSSPARIYQVSRGASQVNNGFATDFYDQASYVIDPQTGKLVVNNVDFDTDPFGGNVLVEGSMELLFNLPFVKDQRSVRTGFFIDAGNVFSTNCRESQVACFDVDAGELRYSAGLGLTWITGFGPLTFSLGKALKDDDFDETEVFQFSLGRGF